MKDSKKVCKRSRRSGCIYTVWGSTDEGCLFFCFHFLNINRYTQRAAMRICLKNRMLHAWKILRWFFFALLGCFRGVVESDEHFDVTLLYIFLLLIWFFHVSALWCGPWESGSWTFLDIFIGKESERREKFRVLRGSSRMLEIFVVVVHSEREIRLWGIERSWMICTRQNGEIPLNFSIHIEWFSLGTWKLLLRSLIRPQKTLISLWERKKNWIQWLVKFDCLLECVEFSSLYSGVSRPTLFSSLTCRKIPIHCVSPVLIDKKDSTNSDGHSLLLSRSFSFASTCVESVLGCDPKLITIHNERAQEEDTSRTYNLLRVDEKMARIYLKRKKKTPENKKQKKSACVR